MYALMDFVISVKIDGSYKTPSVGVFVQIVSSFNT